MKVISGLMMGSISVLSEAVHSSIDLLASFVAFFSIRKAVVPEDDDHPFGHGKYENVSGLIEALLIFMAAALIIYEAAKKLLHGNAIENIDAGIYVMLASTVVNFIISRMLYKIAKRTNSMALEADALHLMTDVYTSLGVFLGLILLKVTGIRLLDPIVALGVALLIIHASLELTKRSVSDLVDTSLPKEELEKVISVFKSYPEVASYHKLRARNCGNRKEIDAHLQMNDEISLCEAHNLCDNIEKDIKQAFPTSYVTLHIEPM